MYRIAILEKDRAYLERLIFFLKEHHGESFEINAVESLEDLDLEIMQLSALFFGDDVPVDAALFPANVAVGYLTESDETDERHINKYQSMEQIYKRMMCLCEALSTVDAVVQEEQEAPYQAETVTESGETYRVYHVAEEQIDRLAVKMLAGNRIKGVPQTIYQDGRLKVRITGMESLYEYFSKSSAPSGKEQMLAFLADMITTALSLEEYMLSVDRLLLDPKEIYLSEQADQVLIPYIPIQCDVRKDAGQCLEEIRDFCSVLLRAFADQCSAQNDNASVDAFAQGEADEDDYNNAEEEADEDGYGSIEEGADEDGYGSTEEFDRLQKNAKESLELKQRTRNLKEELFPYLIRKRTGERIAINRNLFKLGKDASYVDYCIRDNPAVSRNHADIVRKPDGYYLIDKGSLNHTFVNGKKLAVDEYRKLENGCLMQLADEVFEFGLK